MTDIQAQDTSAVQDSRAAEPRFSTRMRGYDRDSVDVWVDTAEQRAADLQTQLLDKSAHIATLEADLQRSKRELRYWHDREAFMEEQLEQARAQAASIEREAADRAQRLEQGAQQRAMQLLDRVSAEADAILARSREEARKLMQRYDGDIELARCRLHRLAQVQLDVVHSVRSAITRFDQGLADMELMTPASLLAAAPEIETPQLESAAAAAPTPAAPTGFTRADTTSHGMLLAPHQVDADSGTVNVMRIDARRVRTTAITPPPASSSDDTVAVIAAQN
jgi:DivIVA domain-containing protein